MNKRLARQVIEQMAQVGVREICICPGARNAPLVEVLQDDSLFDCYYWHEERSAAFFSLGRAKVNDHPAAVITTSGTAVGELLPAAMEAYYSGIPLLLITADRPRRFRGSGAPQAAEQVGIFGIYSTFSQDLAAAEEFDLNRWCRKGPAHINVCFEEPRQNNLELCRHSLNEQIIGASQ